LVGKAHYKIALQAQSILKKALLLERIVSLIGEAELNPEDKLIFKRAKLLKNYMTQNFFTTEKQTGRKGSFVPIETTIKDTTDILNGVYDAVSDEKLLYIGSAQEAIKK
jgi:F-type H+-transporting ATPase subunit beta